MRKTIISLLLVLVIGMAANCLPSGNHWFGASQALAVDAGSGNTGTSGSADNSVKAGIGTRLNEVVQGNFNEETGENSLLEFVGYIITVFLSLFGVIFVFLVIYAGFTWMTAQGDKGKVDRAQTTIKVAIIGLIITVAAYAIWQFVFVRIVQGENPAATTTQIP